MVSVKLQALDLRFRLHSISINTKLFFFIKNEDILIKLDELEKSEQIMNELESVWSLISL